MEQDDLKKLSCAFSGNGQENAISRLAIGSLPNSFFSRPWEVTTMEYWQGYLFVLIKRGLPKIADVKADLIEWLQDPCWLGFNEVVNFIIDNKLDFKEIMQKYLFIYFEKNEPEFFEYLFLVYKKCFAIDDQSNYLMNKLIDDMQNEKMTIELKNEYKNILKKIL